MNIFQKIDKVAAMRRLLKQRVEQNYAAAWRVMNDQLLAYVEAEMIAEMWRLSKPGRVAGVDSTFPLYVSMTLAKDDDICVGGMLFLEHVEEHFQVEAQDRDTSYALKSYTLNQHLVLVFSAHLEGACRVVEKQVPTEMVQAYKTERTVVCNE